MKKDVFCVILWALFLQSFLILGTDAGLEATEAVAQVLTFVSHRHFDILM